MKYVITLRDPEGRLVGYFSRRWATEVNWTPSSGSAKRYTDYEAVLAVSGLRAVPRATILGSHTIQAEAEPT